MDSKLLVIDNFLPQLDFILPKIQEVPLYKLEEYNTKFNKKENWPGKRSQTLIFENPILYAYVMEVILKKVDFLKNTRFNCEMFLHLRRNEDVDKDWIHKDVYTFASLIYLNKTNLSSGTKIYTDEKKETIDIKYVQNRFVMYNGIYNHVGYGHFGETSSDGRLTFNLFINTL
jgi:hypothetical protein